MPYLLGLDVGTTGAKGLLIDETGRVAASATGDYPLANPRPLWSEQDPEDWWLACADCMRRVLALADIAPEQVAGVGFSGQMHGLVLLDEDGRVLRPAILWNDQRTGDQCRIITERLGLETLLKLTGNPVLPGFTAPKLLWVAQNEPELFARTARFLLPKDYVRFRLTGTLATDVSDASGTSLFDVANRTWSDAMFDALDIPRAWAPDCVESPEVCGRVTVQAAGQTGLAPGTPVVGGGGDQAAQAIGTGLVTEGKIAATLGTSGVVFAPTQSPRIDPAGRLHAFCHAVPGMWHVMGVMLAAGGSLRWFRDELGNVERSAAGLLDVEPYDLIASQAARAPAGCEGLVFLPYLSGERTPHPDPNARGAFVGLTLRHGKRHLARAVLEGVAYGLRDSLTLVRELGTSPESLRVSGGGARSELWRQILADVFDLDVATVNLSEGAALGAALLAGVGAKVFTDVEQACDRIIRETSRLRPDPDNRETYDKGYTVYRNLYPALKPTFDAMVASETQHPDERRD